MSMTRSSRKLVAIILATVLSLPPHLVFAEQLNLQRPEIPQRAGSIRDAIEGVENSENADNADSADNMGNTNNAGIPGDASGTGDAIEDNSDISEDGALDTAPGRSSVARTARETPMEHSQFPDGASQHRGERIHPAFLLNASFAGLAGKVVSMLRARNTPEASKVEDLKAQFLVLKNDLQDQLSSRQNGQALDLFSAKTLLEIYFYIAEKLVELTLLSTKYETWNLTDLRKFSELLMKPDQVGKLQMEAGTPTRYGISANAQGKLVYALPQRSLLIMGVRTLMKLVSQENYLNISRCVLGLSYADKYVLALMSTRGADLSARVRGWNAPFCMGLNLSDYLNEQIILSYAEGQSVLARKVVLENFKLPPNIFPVDLRHYSAYQFRLSSQVPTLKMESEWGRFLLAPELLADKRPNENQVLSLADAQALAKRFATLQPDKNDTPQIRPLLAYDAQLAQELRQYFASLGAKINISDEELERRLRLGQILYFNLYLNGALKKLSLGVNVSDGFEARMAAQIEGLFQEVISSALLESLAIVAQATVDKAAVFQTPGADISEGLAEIAFNAFLRHKEKILNEGTWNQFTRLLIKDLSAQTKPEAVTNAGFSGFEKSVTEAAKEMKLEVDSKIDDKDLIYNSDLVLKMLEVEFQQSSMRVQEWYDYIKHAGGPADKIRAVSVVDAHITKNLPQPERCQPQPLNMVDRAWIGASTILGYMFGRKSSVGSPDSTDLADCKRFVRLTEFAQLRGKQPAKTMAGVVQALDTLWSETNRKSLLKYYRALLKAEKLNKFRLLDLMVDGRQLYEVLASPTGGTHELLKAMDTATSNLETLGQELLNVKNIKDLEPVILNSTILDSTFNGEFAALFPNNGDGPSAVSAYLSFTGLSQITRAYKINSAAELGRVANPALNVFAAWSVYHTRIKNYLILAKRSQDSAEKVVFEKLLSGIWPILGFTAIRRLMGTYAPNFVAQGALTQYMAANQTFARGYFSVLTPVFIGDYFYQDWVKKPSLDDEAQTIARYSYTEINDDSGPAVLAADRFLTMKRQIELDREEAISRQQYSAALTAMALAPAILMTVGQSAISGGSVMWFRHVRYANLFSKPRTSRAYISTLSKLNDRLVRKLNRVASYRQEDLRVLGLHGEYPRKALYLDTLQAALKKIQEGNSSLVEVKRAEMAYRRIVTDLNSAFAHWQVMPAQLRSIVSEIVTFEQGNRRYIERVIEEYQKVVVGL